MIARQVRAEGVDRIALVTDEPDKYPARTSAGRPALTIHHRDDLDDRAARARRDRRASRS